LIVLICQTLHNQNATQYLSLFHQVQLLQTLVINSKFGHCI
jgi:hypothetical protein